MQKPGHPQGHHHRSDRDDDEQVLLDRGGPRALPSQRASAGHVFELSHGLALLRLSAQRLRSPAPESGARATRRRRVQRKLGVFISLLWAELREALGPDTGLLGSKKEAQ